MRGVRRRRTGVQPSLPGIDPPPARRRRRRVPAHERRSAPLRVLTEQMPRRSFLSRMLGAVGVAIGGVVAVPAGTAVVWPALRSSDQQWSPVGRISGAEDGQPDLSVVGEPVLSHFTNLVSDAFISAQPRDTAVYVINHGDGQFTVFDVRCTHLGCPVRWEPGQREFISPCHNGLFDEQGRVTAGPPPRPLDRFEWKVEDGVLYASKLYQVDEDLERLT